MMWRFSFSHFEQVFHCQAGPVIVVKQDLAGISAESL